MLVNDKSETWRGSVKSEWCDYNGHFNLAYYVVVFDYATDIFYEKLGIGENYLETVKCSWFTAEAHVCYLAEVFSSEEVYCISRIIGFDKKRLHYFHEMYRSEDGILVATNELLALHVSLKSRKVLEVNNKVWNNLSSQYELDKVKDKPSQIGRKISLKT